MPAFLKPNTDTKSDDNQKPSASPNTKSTKKKSKKYQRLANPKNVSEKYFISKQFILAFI